MVRLTLYPSGYYPEAHALKLTGFCTMNSLLVTDDRQYENASSPSPNELEWILVPEQPSEKISAFVCIAVVSPRASVSHAHGACGGQ